MDKRTRPASGTEKWISVNGLKGLGTFWARRNGAGGASPSAMVVSAGSETTVTNWVEFCPMSTLT